MARGMTAFAAGAGLRVGGARAGARGAACGRRPRSGVRMQIPPDAATRGAPPLDQDQRGPPDYVWDPSFPGTMKPGIAKDDCFPLKDVLESNVFERMVYQELDMYEICPETHTPDKDLLEWLAAEGRLLEEDGEVDEDGSRIAAGVTEEDLDFGEEDDKMLAYYSKQGEGSSVGASSDFGGIAESGFEGGGLG